MLSWRNCTVGPPASPEGQCWAWSQAPLLRCLDCTQPHLKDSVGRGLRRQRLSLRLPFLCRLSYCCTGHITPLLLTLPDPFLGPSHSEAAHELFCRSQLHRCRLLIGREGFKGRKEELADVLGKRQRVEVEGIGLTSCWREKMGGGERRRMQRRGTSADS